MEDFAWQSRSLVRASGGRQPPVPSAPDRGLTPPAHLSKRTLKSRIVVKAKIRSYQEAHPRHEHSRAKTGADDLARLCQGSRDVVGDLAAGLGQVGSATAAPADDGRDLLEPVPRVHAGLDQVLRDPGDELDLLVGRRGQKHRELVWALAPE